MSRKLLHHDYERLKVSGADFIEDYGFTYPLDPYEIAAALGVEVIVHVQGLPTAAWFCDTTDGYAEMVQTARGWAFRIHLNGTTSTMRQRFTLMHEIAHIWLDHLRSDGLFTNDAAEAEANFLASYLLAPDALVVQQVPLLSVAAVATTFQMSDEAARLAYDRVFRATNLNALGKPHDRRILDSARFRADPAWTEIVDESWGSA